MVMLRTAAASYTTAIVAFIVMTALHLRWLHLSAHAGDVLSAYGAGLVVLGVLVGSRPYLRTGFAGLVDAVLAQDDAGYLIGPDYLRELEEQRRAARPQAVRDVLAERVIAVVVVIVGTLLNGWGRPLHDGGHGRCKRMGTSACGQADMWLDGNQK